MKHAQMYLNCVPIIRKPDHNSSSSLDVDRTTFSEDPRARSSSNGHSSLRAREIAAQLIEDDLKGAFQQLRLQEERARQKGPAFPLANAVGMLSTVTPSGLLVPLDY